MSFFAWRRGRFIGAGLIVLAIIILVVARKNGKPDYETAAVTRENGRDVVRVVRDQVPTVVAVTLGIRATDGSVEIIEGLAEGDIVVTTPAE